MKIRLKTLMAGPDGVFQPGSVIDRPNEEAEALISAGYAECLEPRIETATTEPGTRAVKPVPRPRRVP